MLVTVCIFVNSLYSIILHEDFEPPEDWTSRPSSKILGRWGNNACCVVISPDCIITTNHQGGGINTKVEIDGKTYSIAKIERYDNSDIRIAKLSYADFSEYAEIYDGSGELLRTVVIGGYGKGRGEPLKTVYGTTYGYKWAGSSNTIQRWGTNIIDNILTDPNLLEADFDPPGASATAYEATLAQWDSGGGWFSQINDKWFLMGISFSVTTHPDNPSQTWFRDPLTGLPSPDKLFAHRVSDYAEWINQTLSKLSECGTVAEDINSDCKIDIIDLRAMAKWWTKQPLEENIQSQRADINNDLSVNLLDFAKLSNRWKDSY